MTRFEPHIQALLDRIQAWASGEEGIAGLVLVGSQARGEAGPDSDLDLVLLCAHPEVYLRQTSWTGRFGAIAAETQEDWGDVVSIRVRYAGGPEVEFGVTDVSWGADPAEAGAARVLRPGAVVLFDRGVDLGGRIQAFTGRTSLDDAHT